MDVLWFWLNCTSILVLSFESFFSSPFFKHRTDLAVDSWAKQPPPRFYKTTTTTNAQLFHSLYAYSARTPLQFPSFLFRHVCLEMTTHFPFPNSNTFIIIIIAGRGGGRNEGQSMIMIRNVLYGWPERTVEKYTYLLKVDNEKSPGYIDLWRSEQQADPCSATDGHWWCAELL